MIEFTLNGQPVHADAAPDTPVLWVVRDTFKLKGSKYGCGAGLCGACTMHLDGQAVRACVNPDFGIQGTGGSTSIKVHYRQLREAGTQCRALLLEAAAKALGIPTSQRLRSLPLRLA